MLNTACSGAVWQEQQHAIDRQHMCSFSSAQLSSISQQQFQSVLQMPDMAVVAMCCDVLSYLKHSLAVCLHSCNPAVKATAVTAAQAGVVTYGTSGVLV